MIEFTFLRPDWLWLLLLTPVVFWLLGQNKKALSTWNKVCDSALMPYILRGGKQQGSSWLLKFVVLLSWILLSLALGGPSWQRIDLPVFEQDVGRVILLDASNSMLAGDLPPSRIVQARLKLIDLINGFEEGQTGLIVFAGDAFVVAPLTDDKKTLLELIPSLEPDLMPVQGSRPDRAINKAAELLQQSGHVEGDIILVTDTEATAKLRQSTRKVHSEGFRVHVFAFASEKGAPIPLKNGFLKDRNGNTVTPRLDDQLSGIARDGGGIYQVARQDNLDINRLLSRLDSLNSQSTSNESDQHSQQRQDQGFFLLIPLALLSLMLFRKGWLFAVILLVSPVRQSQAFDLQDWKNLWLNTDQQAYRALKNKQPEALESLDASPGYKGESSYRLKEFDKAIENYSQDDSRDSQFNLGNALAKSGKLEEAIKAYDQALQRNPQNEDADFNKKLVEKLLEEQKKQQQDQEKQDQEQKDKDQDQQDQQKQDQQDQQDQQDNQQQSDQDQQQNQNQEKDQKSDQQSKEQQDQSEQQKDDEQGKKEEQDQQQKDQSEQSEAQQQAAKLEEELSREEQQAMEQWLRRVPDDPGGLMRRKFLYQYRQRGKQQNNEQNW